MKMTLEDLILTAWCVFEDSGDTQCKLVLNYNAMQALVSNEPGVYENLIAALVREFKKAGVEYQNRIFVTVDTYHTHTLKIKISTTEPDKHQEIPQNTIDLAV